MSEYHSKYVALEASIFDRKITIEDALKIRTRNNLGTSFKTYLTVVNDRMRTNKELEDLETLFKVIEEDQTRMKAGQRACADFASAKSQLSLKARRRRRR